MKECVYCGNKIKGKGIYFCDECKESVKRLGHFNTGKIMSDFVAQAYWYLEENGGNYWRNLSDFKDSTKEEQELMGKFNFIRPIDYIRFNAYRKYLGKDVMEFPMNAENLNNMEQWYLDLADKESKCDNNHDCEHCDWTECPLEVEKETDGESK